MELESFMAEYKEKVEEELRKFFTSKKNEIKHELLRRAVETIEEYTLRGGKRIRALLMIIGYRMYGGEGDEIIKAAASLELVQSYFLIHDDIMDESELRRGKKTVHKIYEEEHLHNGYPGNPQRFGENVAIIAGDLANVYAFEILSDTNFPHDRKDRVMKELERIMKYTGYGQLIDVYSSMLSHFSEEDLLLLHEYKTANYTIYGPLALGAILAGRNPEELKDFAIPIGIAFQLQDDILGLFGDEKKIGKPVTSDLAEGKKTLLIIKALENCNDAEREKIMNALGNPAVTIEQLNDVRDIVEKTGSLDYSRNLAAKLVEEGKRALANLDIPSKEYREILEKMADYIIKRTM